MPAPLATWWNGMPPEWQDHHDIERGWLEARLDAANAAFQRMLAEAELHRGEDGFIDFQRLVVAPWLKRA